jgi:2-polyprenyl-6-methoxyphenol hydroxylase-like FAD-dependent oxidoreductase
MKPKTILISGIGIAGPTLAYWLSEHGHRPTLIERAPRLRTSGYVIDFWGRGFDIAARMGLLPDVKSLGYDVNEVRLVDSKGKRVGGFNVDVFRALTQGRYVSIPRGDLAKLIYRQIDGRVEALFGDSIREIKQASDSVEVAFEHAPPRRFDLVIGADGQHSVVRRLVFGSEDRFEKYLGHAVAAFEVAGYRPRDELVFVSHNVPGKQVSRFTLRDDRTLFLFIFSAPEKAAIGSDDLQAQKAVLRSEFKGVGWECPQILAALDTCTELYFDHVSQIRMDTWTRGRVALVGDAAFCPSLLAGQGTALAMAAAYVLAGEIANHDRQPELGLQRYQQLLYSFMTAKQEAATKLAGSFAPKTEFGLFFRNQVTKVLQLPFIAKLTLGRSLLDRMVLPEYPVQREVEGAEKRNQRGE